VIKTAGVNKYILIELKEWINRAIGILVLLLLTLSILPDGVLEDI